MSIHSLALGFESQVSSESLSNLSAHAGNHTYMALTPSFDKLALRLAGERGKRSDRFRVSKCFSIQINTKRIQWFHWDIGLRMDAYGGVRAAVVVQYIIYENSLFKASSLLQM